MCKALQEMMEESREEGRREEREESIRIFVRANRDDGIADQVIADKLQKYYSLSEDAARKALGGSASLP